MDKETTEGVKVGLELHQRLSTKHKLFCKCSTKGNEDKSREIKRKLHAVPSELGQIDPAALFESKKAPLHTYDFYKGTCCLVETDDEPPHEINEEAIEIGIIINKMMNAENIDEIHFMRKTVIDGSNTSGFQRTAIVGLNGKIMVILSNGKEKEVGIQTIAIEEESCGIIGEQKGSMERFRLDRLGIPLVEIATTPVIKSGKEAREVAETIGLMLRSTGKMMRGIGTIRQDINISVPGGARVEVKGVQDLDLIEKVVDNEISRQKKLIELIQKINEIKKKNPNIDGELKIEDVTDIFKNTKSKFIKKAVEKGNSVLAAKLKSMKGFFGTELYPEFRYGSELSGYAKTQGMGGIIHCDEDMNKYGFTEEIAELAKKLKLEDDDGWIMVVGEKPKCESALALVYKRAYETKVPEETRRADLEGKTHYMRPLPGAARMYPETDVQPLKITKEIVKKAESAPSFKEIEEKIKKILNPEMAQKMIRSDKLNLFLELIEEGIEPTLAAVTCEDTLKTLRRDNFDVGKIGEESIKETLLLYKEGRIVKSAIPELLKLISKDPKAGAAALAKQMKLTKITGKELKELLAKENIKDLQSLMIRYRLNVDPQEAKEVMKG